VAEAVGDLPQPEREVVVLRHYHDLTFGQIAELLGTPVSTVKSRVGKGFGRLRGRLRDLEP
jgi:RNA polymerase sigma-70 factor (ECF subfamily)